MNFEKTSDLATNQLKIDEGLVSRLKKMTDAVQEKMNELIEEGGHENEILRLQFKAKTYKDWLRKLDAAPRKG
jgi:hypothetical protein